MDVFLLPNLPNTDCLQQVEDYARAEVAHDY